MQASLDPVVGDPGPQFLDVDRVDVELVVLDGHIHLSVQRHDPFTPSPVAQAARAVHDRASPVARLAVGRDERWLALPLGGRYPRGVHRTVDAAGPDGRPGASYPAWQTLPRSPTSTGAPQAK